MSQVQQPYLISIGTKMVQVEDEDFACAYDAGYETFHCYHGEEEAIDASLLLFQLRNGWNGERSEMWTTGYILGWLAAFYEQKEGQLARSIDVNPENATSDPIQQAN